MTDYLPRTFVDKISGFQLKILPFDIIIRKDFIP